PLLGVLFASLQVLGARCRRTACILDPVSKAFLRASIARLKHAFISWFKDGKRSWRSVQTYGEPCRAELYRRFFPCAVSGGGLSRYRRVHAGDWVGATDRSRPEGGSKPRGL